MANGEPMTPTEAKAVLDRWTALGTWMGEEKELAAALATMIAENERLTAPLDADEGRELVNWLRQQAGLGGAGGVVERLLRASAAYIERQAARIAALTAIPEDVEGLCKLLDYYGEPVRRLENGHAAIKQAMRATAAALRAYAAREADRGRVDAEVRARIEAYEGALTFYANPEVYNAHPHGPAFDRRDLSFLAQSALEPSLPDDGSCVRCGSVPRNARGLCATCLDEDAVGAGEVNRLRGALENLMNAGHAVTTLHSRWAPEEAEYYTCLLDGVNAARQIFNMEPII